MADATFYNRQWTVLEKLRWLENHIHDVEGFTSIDGILYVTVKTLSGKEEVIDLGSMKGDTGNGIEYIKIEEIL